MPDATLFKGTAPFYAKYRRGYPKEFFDHLTNLFNLDGTGRLLDLGCGTGQIAIPLASDFHEVVAVDPDADMLEEGAYIANEKGITNIIWRLGRAEDINRDFGFFKLTTIGTAFHWMDYEKVVRVIYNLTDPQGGVVIVYDSGDDTHWNTPGVDGWRKVRNEILKKYLGEKRRAGQSFYKTAEKDFADYLTESPFGTCEKWDHTYTRTWTVDEIVGFTYSTSFGAQRLFDGRLAEFDAELRSRLRELNPEGVFTEEATTEALIARKR